MKKEFTITEKIDLNIAKIFFLANQINRKTEMCCFANDHGHVSSIEIRLFETKKDWSKEPITFELSYECNEEFEWRRDSSERFDESERCVSFLEQTLKAKGIVYNMLNPFKEYIVTRFEI